MTKSAWLEDSNRSANPPIHALSGSRRRIVLRAGLVGPPNCEITGVVMTPDLRTMFVNIQHPGEYPRGRADPDDPARYSSRPAGMPGARPRSATVVIRRGDGGIVGT